MALAYRTALAAAAALTVTAGAAVAGCGSTAASHSGGSARAVTRVTGTSSDIPLTPAAAPESISETGSTLLFPLFKAWAGAFHQQHHQVTITTRATGSGAGIAEASAGIADIGASDAYLSSGDLVQNPELLNIPLAVAAQQVNYNLPGLAPGVHLRLDAGVLAQMYEGRITSWNSAPVAALNPGVRLPGTRVVPLHRSDSSGDTFLFTSYVAAHDAQWSSSVGYGTSVDWPDTAGGLAEKGNAGMVAGCRQTPGCVVYVGISYLSAALADHLGEAELANASGQFELPTAATISAAVQSFAASTPPNETISMIDGPGPGSYPIVNYEYAVVSVRQRTASRARDLQAFLRWAIGAGNSARYLASVRFEPLPGSVAILSDEQIAKIV